MCGQILCPQTLSGIDSPKPPRFDKAYSSGEIRQQLRQSATTPAIPKRSNQKRQGRFNRGLYRERNFVTRLINRLKQYRRIATCYKKYAINYQDKLMIAAIRLWL
ncbi:MAG TPA: hypothetical protein DEV81_05265 [Cyanobacteria bacterium UBA11049]|nr:hypothetical protein [Cyanobacteria bacterium UBA11049]